MERKLVNSPELAHEQRLERLQRLVADLQRAVDVAEEQRRILRDLAHSAEELAHVLESSDGSPPVEKSPRKKQR